MKRKFLYSESKLAEVTGLSRAQLKTCRVKGEYRHGKGKGGPVELSEKGVQRVLEKYGIKDANLDGARIKGSSGSQPARHEEQSPPRDAPRGKCIRCDMPTDRWVTVGYVCESCASISALPDLKLVHVSQLVPNKRIVRAQNGTGEIYSVIVPSSEVWAIGDPLRIKPSKHHGHWELVGKAPRWRSDRLYRHEFV